MNHRNDIPQSPLSTGLSGSAREVELRVRNIHTGRRKRPALILMAVVVLVIALSGVLVAFSTGGERRHPGQRGLRGILWGHRCQSLLG